MKLIEELTGLAGMLDENGLTKEADVVDGLIKRIAKKLPPFLEECPGCGGAMKKGADRCKKCSAK